MANEFLDLSKFNLVEVVPGSPDDPFAERGSSISTPDPQGATPANEEPQSGSRVILTTDGLQVQTETSEPAPQNQTSQSQPASPASPAPESKPAEPAQVATESIEEMIRKAAEAQVGERLRNLQSVYDKKIAELERLNREAREALKKAERERALSAEDLSDEDKERLRRSYELEDREAELAERERKVTELHLGTYRVTLAQEYEKFGVTFEDLEKIESVEELDAYCMQKELEFYRQGGVSKKAAEQVATMNNQQIHQQAVADQAKAQQGQATSSAPAGAQAPPDVSGNPPARTVVQLKTGKGRDVMRENIEAIPYTILRF